MVRLKAVWEQEYREWTRRDLSRKRDVYIWADGLHVNVRLDEERSCILVVMGADEHGNKELVESAASWREMLLDLRRRGLLVGPRLATAGADSTGFTRRATYWTRCRSRCRARPRR